MLKLSISVIITCHNLHEYLEEAVNSLMAQTMSPTEIIVIHDSCTPAPVFSGTTTVFRDTHKGVSGSRNEGVNLATSGNILFLDADDVLEEHFIEAMVKTKDKTKADIIYPNVLLWSSWHKEIKFKNAWHEAPKRITMKNMLEFNQVVVSSLIPRDLYQKLGGMKNLPILEDYDFFLECVKSGVKFARANESVLKYRQRASSRNRQAHELKNEWFYQIREQYESKKS